MLCLGDAKENLIRFDRLQKGKPYVGTLHYELKDEFEKLGSSNKAYYHWEPGFFSPSLILVVKPDGELSCESTELAFAHSFLDKVREVPKEDFSQTGKGSSQVPELIPLTNKQDYLSNVGKIKQHIIDGDVYELNYCQNFTASEVDINPFESFKKVAQSNPNPFAAFVREQDKFLICGSMERYLSRRENKLVSQPIKGTAKRGATEAENKLQKEVLLADEKERAENIMIVDLVRNDLSKSGTTGSITVEELFGVYEFPTVLQMISTVSAVVDEDCSFPQLIRDSFPMGSMTGAPKISAMHLIERYEEFRRGVYSGSIGYIRPTGDFDLNVVIRTAIYDQREKTISIPVGSAITVDSDPEREYEECLAKIDKLSKLILG